MSDNTTYAIVAIAALLMIMVQSGAVERIIRAWRCRDDD